jgi:hypothetical protein
MHRKSFAVITAFVLSLLGAGSAFAHHSFSAEFDFDKPITIHGTVTKWEMINPHAYISMDVKSENGTTAHWSVQIGAPSFLYRNGWRKDSVKPGDDLTISGFQAKDGSNTVFGQQARLADGRRVLGGPFVGATTGQNPAPDSGKPANQ